ncbi:DUF3987 domain-containing protein [Acinetobacter baumannii]|uniref:DUF3987 domain-containing protein n=1 Tax=Acinetobacter baumannii TaxID=470 RepID=UPI001FF405CC|nr:DUF3987 domain-containing protein [Acinetobacter baumannii]MCJ9118970.1 DUF3987 domain-containing protein [Acinetobacter baumannii]MCJ9181405.1 DUF3987 domain-containing protein [Acinetobacter baumannii]MCJ9185104.1 DUF3987 domain-containing protein [Acinetobacter baumannii]MCJ9192343.1 DUF3987 domain-containing protein [Acinetobacter baumannii]MCJ9199718.1 DUF3987 domain-containing protein [Acinetobacter baumannii]
MALRSVSEMEYHPISEKLVKVLQTKTQNTNPLFFRVLVSYYFGLVSAQMRAGVVGFMGKKPIPINVYAMNLSPSGSGKGHSSGVIETEVLNRFFETFREHTFPILAQQNLETLSIRRATRNGTDPSDELEKLNKEFNSLGALMISFSEATSPAIKQMRQKLLMANAGACNLQVDEIGVNLQATLEPLTTYLELYDKGLVKDKLVKSTSDNVRFEKIDGSTPANLLLFGSPQKLLDGGQTEQLLMELLEMGYARRCLFGYIRNASKQAGLTAEQLYDQLFNSSNEDYLEELSVHFEALADMVNINKQIRLPKDVCLLLLEYKLLCEQKSRDLNEAEAIRKSEMDHRYFKALKLAGAYAFIDMSPEITQSHLENAIKLVEESGKACEELLTPERNYVKVAKFLATTQTEVTLADLDAECPAYKGSRAVKDEIITMATAWGYKNNVIIKKSFVEGIQFLRGETLEETNLDEIIISYSRDMTEGYRNERVPFSKLPKLFTADGYHWINHHLKGGYRKEENSEQGFNAVVLDIDGTCQLGTAMLLLKDYKAIYYTTKRSTPECNRFRIVLPTNYILKLDHDDYREFYLNVLKALPFEGDESAAHRCKKWLSNVTEAVVTDGELFDVLPFIPKTSKNEERERKFQDLASLDNLERWVINNTGDGNRNVQLHKYARVLVDAGLDFNEITTKVTSLNDKLPGKLSETELSATIFKTVANEVFKKQKDAA